MNNKARWGSIVVAAAIAACGGGSADDHDHDHSASHIDTAGRIVLAEAAAPRAHVFDLDAGESIAALSLTHPASALHPSPGNRYAVAIQRSNDAVQFIDGGIWQEDHVDHLHDYKQAPQLRPGRLDERRPTHYQTHGPAAALFNDGTADPLVPASVSILTEARIHTATAERRLALPVPMHGTAEPIGEWLLTTYRDPQAASTLPSHVELYRQASGGYQFVGRFDEACPELHGSASNDRHTVFGCADGVLVVTRDGQTFETAKLSNPDGLAANARIGTIVAHPEGHAFVGIAGSALYEIDPVEGTIAPIPWADGRIRRAHGFDVHGQNFVVLDDTGTLHVLDAHDGWKKRAAIAVVPVMPTEAPFPTIAFSRAADKAYVTDPAGRALVEIDLKTAGVGKRHALAFTPSAAVWVGIPRHTH